MFIYSILHTYKFGLEPLDFYMKSLNEFRNYEDMVDKRLVEIASLSYNFNKIPPIIGIIIANKFGNTLMVFEYEDRIKNNYRPIKSYLSKNDKNFLDIDLISMYFSSFRAFAGQTNIQNLSNLEIHGSNIKVQIYFLFDNYMIILFLNSKIDLNLKNKAQIVQYFEDMLSKHEFEFKHFNASHSRKVIRILEAKGTAWLKNLNKKYKQFFENEFFKKHEIIDIVMNQMFPIIQKELGEYLIGIPEDILLNISKEIRNKIQDKMCEFNIDLS